MANVDSLQIHFNAPKAMKDKFNQVLKGAGVSANDAYRIFMQQTINHNGLPFKVISKPRDNAKVVNGNPHFSKDTVQAIKEYKKGKLSSFDVDEKLRKALFNE